MGRLDINKPLTTRRGQPVRILATDAKGPYPLIGAIDRGDCEVACSWTRSGAMLDRVKDNDDLLNTEGG